MKTIAILLLLLVQVTYAQVKVSNAAELVAANNSAKPGEVITLKNGEWRDIDIALDCKGTSAKPIVFKAETAGKVIITGRSTLKLGGEHITVDGLYFTNGYAGSDAVITFHIDKRRLANHCRVTNTVVNGFNNPRRLDENYWVAFYGKNNRLDHCSFFDKKNIGVLLAVILEDDRSRENFHAIDHNHFGFRTPLASNGGEIIRVGVSQHCEFNSNTQITDNYFEHCDGEAEIISIKSGNNLIRNNLFKECQGSVVLRHGDFNTVENNIFLGNDKPGTGGVRVINKGQWVVNNLFYQCRGTGFRSPLAVMNGVPNSAPNRYVTASDAVIANNTFYECAPLSFCEGADAERSEAPFDIHMLNNIVYNTRDAQLYRAYDKTGGFSFAGNSVNKVPQQLLPGFKATSLVLQKHKSVVLVKPGSKHTVPGSLQQKSTARIKRPLSSTPGYSGAAQLLAIEANAYEATGAKWFGRSIPKQPVTQRTVYCKTAAEVVAALQPGEHNAVTIYLTGTSYSFSGPVNISANTTLTTTQKSPIVFQNASLPGGFFFQLVAGKNLRLANLQLDLDKAGSGAFLTSDTSANSLHSNMHISNCKFSNLSGTFFNAARSMILDSIIVNKTSFENNTGTLFRFMDETDKKGYYNVEKMKITGNIFKNHNGQLLSMLRGGNDESTMGPMVEFSGNVVERCNTTTEDALIYLYGTQVSLVTKNVFRNANASGVLIHYEDVVRARHVLKGNSFINSGKVLENKYMANK